MIDSEDSTSTTTDDQIDQSTMFDFSSDDDAIQIDHTVLSDDNEDPYMMEQEDNDKDDENDEDEDNNHEVGAEDEDNDGDDHVDNEGQSHHHYSLSRRRLYMTIAIHCCVRSAHQEKAQQTNDQ